MVEEDGSLESISFFDISSSFFTRLRIVAEDGNEVDAEERQRDSGVATLLLIRDDLRWGD